LDDVACPRLGAAFDQFMRAIHRKVIGGVLTRFQSFGRFSILFLGAVPEAIVNE
jgi:hypothetical protein